MSQSGGRMHGPLGALFRAPDGIARADRQTGAMPSEVQRRADADELWPAFRRHVGIAWTGHRVRDFIAGWDAARRSVGADGEHTGRGQSGGPT